MPLVIKGSSSGQVTVDVPAAAGTNTLTVPAETGTVVTKDSNGIMVNATQPAFSVTPSSDQDNATGGGTAATVVFGTEIFDKNADFASNTFTAPVTGTYFLNAIVKFHDHTTGMTTGRLNIVTSNRSYLYEFDPAENISGSGDGTAQVTAVADMDASDTATVTLQIFDATDVVDINAANTTFQGFLLG
tara:strand:+ start:224 stop:787 length:564 start_codon:yes stop_codon:yes gene_type:complete